MGGGLLAGAAEHLAIAHRAGSEAIAGPLGGHGIHGPAEAMGGGIDGAIGTTGAAMEHQLHEAASGSGAEGGGDHQGRPIEITTTTGNDDQGAAMGAAERARGRWIGQRAKQRRGGRRCGARKEQTHGGIGRMKGGRRAARAAAGQGFRPLLKDKRTGVLAACMETPVLAQAGEIGRGDKGTG